MSIISNAKEIADLVKKLGDIELYRKIVELEGEIIELTCEKRELDDELIKLNALLKTSKEMNFKEPFYCVEGDSTPFCPRCWEADKTQVHLNDTNTIGSPWKCPNCKSGFSRSK
ncbi:MAG TPA: hypothetical protein ENH23_04315 [candidate division Zixibacteria bacterium]|nr:hypothetical protein [candidate division Zixibacteria bacterium]